MGDSKRLALAKMDPYHAPSGRLLLAPKGIPIPFQVTLYRSYTRLVLKASVLPQFQRYEADCFQTCIRNGHAYVEGCQTYHRLLVALHVRAARYMSPRTRS